MRLPLSGIFIYQNKVNFPVEFLPSENDPHLKYIDVLKNNESADCVIVVVPDNLHFEIVENRLKILKTYKRLLK